ncbi:MAG TPA: M50 family metallopeptidase [Solirubrobacteraceae bacterium]|jgi:regulator of sigma E protease|nr:M50 family metallopeptidase [Solirubrobacteraceae bacterium]
MSWVLTILGIVVLIVLHELGHFTVAKLVGMRVERFSLFFPPTIFRVKRGETEYAIGAIPAGGYVKITGMNPEEIEDLDPEATRRAYYNQPPWKRIAVILAGPGVNIVIAFALFWAILLSGSVTGAATLEGLNPSIQTREATSSVRTIVPHEPADGVLRAGDRIVAVDGRRATVGSAMSAISSHRCAGKPTEGCRASTPVALTVKRGVRTLTLSVYPRYSKAAGRMLIGFDFGEAAKRFGAVAAAGVALREMWQTTTSMITNIGKAFTSAKVRHQFHSIVGITEIAHETVLAGAGYALVFLGFISLVLAVINLFPFLPLDGGHIVWSLAEKLRGKRISVGAMYRYSSVGIVLLAFLVINGISNDLSRIAG